MTIDKFYDAFIGFIESKGWYFGGGIREIIDGYYILPDGTKGAPVFDDLEKTKNESQKPIIAFLLDLPTSH